MNTKQLVSLGYVNVTGLACRSFGQDEMKFSVPTLQEYPTRRHISGEDFIFLLLENGKTWYKSVDLSKTIRSSLYYHDDLFIIAMDSRNPENTSGTPLIYPFELDANELDQRKLDPDCLIPPSVGIVSSAEIMARISGAITQKVGDFTNCLLRTEARHLVPFPNNEYLRAFDSSRVQDIPLPNDQIRSLYMLVVLQAQMDGRFPYGLSYTDFKALVTIPQPPLRCK